MESCQALPPDRDRKIIFVEQVSALIGKSIATIQTAATCKKYMHTIPRPFKMPGTRRNCWYENDVLAWREKNYKKNDENNDDVGDGLRRRRGRPKKSAMSSYTKNKCPHITPADEGEYLEFLAWRKKNKKQESQEPTVSNDEPAVEGEQ